jgi:hypothetical protein
MDNNQSDSDNNQIDSDQMDIALVEVLRAYRKVTKVHRRFWIRDLKSYILKRHPDSVLNKLSTIALGLGISMRCRDLDLNSFLWIQVGLMPDGNVNGRRYQFGYCPGCPGDPDCSYCPHKDNQKVK